MHLLIIPDGNRRHSKGGGVSNELKYDSMMTNVASLIKGVGELNIEEVSFWMFSSDNLKRPPEDVGPFIRSLRKFSDWVQGKQGITTKVIGGCEPIEEILENMNKDDGGTRVNFLVNTKGRIELETPIDAVIRTGGELRLSGLDINGILDAELYFSDKMFPEFKKEDLKEAVLDIKQRQQRHGR